MQVTSASQLGLFEGRRHWLSPRCCGPPRSVQVRKSTALSHQPRRWWYLSQGFPIHHREQGPSAISTPTLGARSAPQAGCLWQMRVGGTVRDRAFCPSSNAKGNENRVCRGSRGVLLGIAGVWHLWPVAEPSRHIRPSAVPFTPRLGHPCDAC